MIQCPNCKKENKDMVKFCVHCGREIPKCPTCGKAIPSKTRFCPYDGSQLPDSVYSLFPTAATPPEEVTIKVPLDPQETIVMSAVAPKSAETAPAFGHISYCDRCGKAFEADGNKLCGACRAAMLQRQTPAQQIPMRPSPPRQQVPQGQQRQTPLYQQVPQSQQRPMPPRQQVPQSQQRPMPPRQQMPQGQQRPMPPRDPARRQAPPPQKKNSRGLVITLVILLILALLALTVLVLKSVLFDGGDDDSDRKESTSHSTTKETERETEEPEETLLPETTQETEPPTETTEPPTETTEEPTEPETTAPTVAPSDRYYDNGNETLLYFIDHCTDEYFTYSYFSGFDERTACIARNAIFARSGRMFETPWIRDYFERCDWYIPLYDTNEFHNGMLNVYQQANLEVILAYETDHGY